MKNEKKYEKKCLLPTDAVLYKAKIIQSVDRKTNTAPLTFALVLVQVMIMIMIMIMGLIVQCQYNNSNNNNIIQCYTVFVTKPKGIN